MIKIHKCHGETLDHLQSVINLHIQTENINENKIINIKIDITMNNYIATIIYYEKPHILNKAKLEDCLDAIWNHVYDDDIIEKIEEDIKKYFIE